MIHYPPTHPEGVAVSQELYDRLQLPGYDPFRDADGCYFDEASAEYAINWIESNLTLTKGEWAGQPFIPFPWVMWPVIGNLFGWKRNGIRRYRTAFIYVPRKASKTETCAAIALLLLYVGNIDDGGYPRPEPKAEIYGCATDRKQGELCFGAALTMVENNDALYGCVKTSDYHKFIETADRSRYEVTAGEKGGGGRGQGQHGKSPYGIIIDELHEFRGKVLIEAMESGMGARKQPLCLFATTADTYRDSICNERAKQARGVRDGVNRDPSFLPVIYETELNEDWHDEKVWLKANPSCPITPSMEFLRSEHLRAQAMTSYENTFKRLYLNMATQQENRWIKMVQYDACGGPEDFDRTTLIGQDCYAGLDAASTNDVTALVLYFPAPSVLLCRFWLPEKAVRGKHRDQSLQLQYIEWTDAGHIETTPGDTLDHDAIENAVFDLAQTHNIVQLRYDDRYCAQLANHLTEGKRPDGSITDPIECLKFNQNASSFNEPSRELERRIAAGEINHLGNPVLRWMAGNVAIKEQQGLIMPVRPDDASTLKIDGIVAAIQAIAGDIHDTDNHGSVYEDRDLFVF